MASFYIETYGCQMNKAETSFLSLHLSQNGMSETDTPDKADTVIIQTCSVRTSAENRIWGRLGYYSAMKKERDFNLVVTGCMAERLKDEIKKRSPAVDYVVGTADKMELLSHLEESSGMKTPGTDYRFPNTYGYSGSFQAFVPIMHGCNNFCSYCIVPYVRGREVSRNAEKILYELKLLEESAVQEVTFLGQNVNSYKGSYKKEQIDFPELLWTVLEQNRRIPWFRFVTSHPKDFSDALIDCIAENPRLCREIHLPVQHGSNSVLRDMRRKYTREEYLRLVERLRKRIPGLALTTDILIGFPGETYEDYRDTLELLKTVGFDDAYTYKYNTREGTPAVDLPNQVPEKIKQERLEEIIAIQRDISNNRRKERLGEVADVLVKKVSKKNAGEFLGVTEFGASVIFTGTDDDIGKIIPLTLTAAAGATFIGEKR